MTIRRIASILLLVACGVFFASAARAQTLEERLLAAAIAEGAAEDSALVLLGRAPAGIDAEALEIAAFDFDPASGRFLVTLTLETGRRFRLQGRVEAGVDVPVLNRAIMAGEVISYEDIEFARLPVSRLSRGALTTAEDIAGNAAKRALRPAVALMKGDVARPLAIRKGDAVTLVYTTPGMELATRGRAMTDGAIGEVIAVQNSQSSRQIDGVVQGPGLVSVSPPRFGATAALN